MNVVSNLRSYMTMQMVATILKYSHQRGFAVDATTCNVCNEQHALHPMVLVRNVKGRMVASMHARHH